MEDTLGALRSLMASHSPKLDALVVPSEDYHQSEYVSGRDKRRQFVSGFTGSAGLALITMKEALLWTDGRYFLQATEELSDKWKLMRIGEDPAVDVWMADNLPKEAAIGVDPWCVSIDTAQRWERAFAIKRQKLVETTRDLVDEVWKNRPPLEINPVIIHPLEFAGRSVMDKLNDLREKLIKEKARGIIITALDEVAWLYNIRGSDVSYCPVVHAFAIVTSNSAFFYVDRRKVSSEVNSYMEENGIEVREYAAVSSDVALLASNQLNGTQVELKNDMEINPSEIDITQNDAEETEENTFDLIWADPGSCCYALYSKLDTDKLLLQPSPLGLAKAIKNPVELEGLKNAHIRDGAAVVQYLVWLDDQMQEIYGASGYFLEGVGANKKKHSESWKLTEVTASDKLEAFRASKEKFRGLSFPTISSVGPNAAIIHYSPHAETCAELDPDKIYLFDSGAQYLDGTTDITRTVHFGKPSEHEKASYTAVLKGHIDLGNARFPNGTNGQARSDPSKMKAQSHLTITLFLLFCGLVCKVGAASVADKCSNDFTKVAPCLDYAKGTANTPTKDCCSGVKSIRDDDPVCLCYFIQQTHNGSEQIKSLGIQEARLLQLPTACSLKNASVTNCPSLLGISPSSPDAAIFTNASTAKPTPTTGTSSSSPDTAKDSNIGTGLGPNSAGLIATAITIFFLFAFPVGSPSPSAATFDT